MAAATAAAAGEPRPVASAAKAIDYNRDVRPILAENCFSCHGADAKARKAGLRLDQAEVAFATRDGVTAIRPGDLAGSELWARVNTDDPDEQMPPPKSRRLLTAAQKEILRQWIEQGAPYAEHWAFVAPQKPPVPEVNAHPVDAFVRARLAAEGLTPAPAADRAILIRRLSLDLTGMPPSAEEVRAFVAETDPSAYSTLVDRLLASPHYGERMALEWLDAARYADTNGFSIDGGRHAWLWRDYVIASFNANQPYDLFLIEQIAGDLLDAPTDAQRIATGFQRNNMVTHEGGTIAEENLVNYNADRVRTLGEAVLGLTLGCAQCHDHKFDPITQKDYYGIFAYFNTLGDVGHDGDGGVNPGPSASFRTVLQTGEAAGLRARIRELEQELEDPAPSLLAAWEADARAELARRGENLALHPVRLQNISTPNSGGGFFIEDERYAVIRHPSGFAAFDVAMELPALAQPVTGLRVVMHPDPGAPAAGWGHGGGKDGKGTFVLTNLSISVGDVPSDQVNLYRMTALAAATANSWEPENRPEGVLNTLTSAGWSPDLAHDGPVHLTATFTEPIPPGEAAFLTAQLNFGRGGNLMARRMEFFVMTGRDDGSSLPPAIQALLAVPATERTPQQTQDLTRYHARHGPGLERTRVELANLRERLAVVTEAFPALVMATSDRPRETFILNRGNYAEPGARVEAATPEFLPPPPPGAPRNRLGLARWITMRENPLTARVVVNRTWQMLFGVGLVRTTADFGTQGEWPSHPELLDWLAVDFMDGGWDMKALVRTIVTSATYQQSSVTTPDALARDPDNRSLARGARFRLPAEFVRDGALKISGLLVPRLGGPSVNPYTPGDPWREISHFASTPATAQSFVQDHGEKLYRRSLYTYWKRTLPPPNMAAFDAPNRETCVVSRSSTITPLQALVLLNDVQFVEAARAFAERILARPGADDARLAWAFAEVVAREPGSAEMAVLRRALARERAAFRADRAAALALLRSGESARNESLDPAEHAAWAQVAALLFNLSEAVTRP